MSLMRNLQHLSRRILFCLVFPLTCMNNSHGKIASPQHKNTPNGTSWKNGVDQNYSPEELVNRLAMHGHIARMIEQDRFRKLVTWLNPMVKMPRFDLLIKNFNLFEQEEAKLKERLTALSVGFACLLICSTTNLVFSCLTVHYIDDEWEKQQKIIKFCPMNPSCNADELSTAILRAIRKWGLDGKVFGIMLDNSFIDGSVGSNVKASLQKWNKGGIGLDELDKFMEKSAKCSKYAMGPIPAIVQYPNCRYASSREYWIIVQKICQILGDFHRYMDSMLNYPSPVDFYDKWDVKDKLSREDDFYRQAGFAYKDEGFSKVLAKMQQKFKEHWELSFFHFCMTMVLDPKYHPIRMRLYDWVSYHNSDREIDDYIHYVHYTLLSLFNEYSNEVEDANSSSGPKLAKKLTWMEICWWSIIIALNIHMVSDH
ncbi:hypothetical protein ACP70R_006483 [Stipagrostis hirtigluma subsp. patula]